MVTIYLPISGFLVIFAFWNLPDHVLAVTHLAFIRPARGLVRLPLEWLPFVVKVKNSIFLAPPFKKVLFVGFHA
jgi:hypothetical protein